MKLDKFFKAALTRYQSQVDRDASLDYKLDELREEVKITATEIKEHLDGLSDEQTLQICEALAEVANGNQNVAALRYMLRLVCAELINKKVQKALNELVRGDD